MAPQGLPHWLGGGRGEVAGEVGVDADYSERGVLEWGSRRCWGILRGQVGG